MPATTWLDSLLSKLVATAGTPLTQQRGTLNFVTGTLVDNPTTLQTDYTPPSGAAGAAGGSLGGTYPNPTVVQVDGAAGVLPVIATETDCNGNAKCKPRTFIGNFATANNTQATAFTSTSLTTGTWKVNIALVADANDNVNGGAWDISFVIKHTGASTAAILTTAPGNIAPDNGSAGTSAWRATVDVVADTFRLRVTGDVALATDFGYVVQIIPVIQ